MQPPLKGFIERVVNHLILFEIHQSINSSSNSIHRITIPVLEFEIETNKFAIYHCRRSLKPQRHSRRRDNGERKRDRVLGMEMTEVLVGVGTLTVQMTINLHRSVVPMMEKSQNLWVEIPVVAIERDIDR